MSEHGVRYTPPELPSHEWRPTATPGAHECPLMRPLEPVPWLLASAPRDGETAEERRRRRNARKRVRRGQV